MQSANTSNLNNIRIDTLHRERELSKETAFQLQKQLNEQQRTLKEVKLNYAHVVPRLEKELALREAAERCSRLDRMMTEKLVDLLDKIQLPVGERFEIDFVGNIGFGTLVFDLQNMESKVRSLQYELKCKNDKLKSTSEDLKRTADELQMKTHLFEDISGEYQNQFQNMSITSFESDEEANSRLAELHAMSTAQEDLPLVE